MKTSRILTSIFALGLIFSVNSFAQTNVSTITTDATVQSTITATGDQDLNFGTFADGTTTSLLLASATNTDLGRFTVSDITTGVSVNFAIDGPADLPSSGSFDALALTLEANIDTDTDPSTGGTAITLTSNDGNADIATTAASTYYVYVGGTADATGVGDYSGAYSTTIQLTVTYN